MPLFKKNQHTKQAMEHPATSRHVAIIGLIITFFSLDVTAKALSLPEQYPIPMTFHATLGLKIGTEAFGKEFDKNATYPIIAGLSGPNADEKTRMAKARWPDKIVLTGDAYGGVSKKDFPAVWPGHLLYKPGTLLARDISPQDSGIFVEDIERIAKSKAFIKRANKATPLTLTLYALDNTGKPDWSHAEYVTVRAVAGRKQLVVERGQWGSRPLSFKAGKAVVAARMMYWRDQWQLNLSLHSPRGGPGNLSAAEWFARKIAQKIADVNADGIEFDVGRWTWSDSENNPMDANNDLIADYGYLDGVNSFGLGGQVFFRELRRLSGADKIIQVDSNDAIYGVRGWKYVNGAQMESFPLANDFDRFSQAFQHLRLWVANAEGAPKFSYPFTKTPTTVFANARMANGAATDFRFRVGFAAASLVGMPHPFASLSTIKFDPTSPAGAKEKVERFGVYNWDEYRGGDLNDTHWLGRPLGDARQELNNMDKNNLLANMNWKWLTDNGFSAEHTQSAQAFSAQVKKTPNGVLPETLWYGVRLAPKNGGLRSLAPGKEYTLEFDARGDDSWHYAGQNFERVPRMIAITGAVNAGKRNAPLSILVDSAWRTYRISFIADGSPVPVFGVSEQIGATEIRNIKLYAGSAERWSREFENGQVLLNMSNTPWHTGVRKSYYKRLKGTQVPEINNGQAIDSDVIVPARDALFLVKRR
ncbi:MAG: hypothetical protein EPN89_10145 [Methylovulum sp.]|nr:MAG: hypothetical protein EPN89_10145 [Methylovulum sp.]